MYSKFIRIYLAGLCIIAAVATSQVFADHIPGHLPGNPLDSTDEDYNLRNRDLVIRDGSNRVRIRLDAQTGDIRVLDTQGNTVTLIDGTDGIQIPVATNGQIVLRDQQGRQRIFLSAETADLILGQEGADGDIFVRNANGRAMITLDGSEGKLQARQIISSHSASGSSEGIDSASIYIQSLNPAIGLRDNTGGNTNGWLIQAGSTGALSFSQGNLNGMSGRVFMLGPDRILHLFNGSGVSTIQLDGGEGTVRVHDIVVTSGGVRFPDGTEQSTATIEGPRGARGPEGPQGPQGPPGQTTGSTFLNCVSGSAQAAGFCSCGQAVQITRTQSSGSGGPCTVATDSGTSCNAGSFEQGALHHSGSCCVCR